MQRDPDVAFTRLAGIARSGRNILALAALVAAVYGRSLRYDFVWDDAALAAPSASREGKPWFVSFFQGFWQAESNVEDAGRSFYRPVVSLSFRLDAMLWGSNPAGFHLTNLLSHMLCVVAAHELARRALKNAWAALLAAAVFAVHPTRAESVCWISGRTDILSALFYLPAIMMFLEWLRGAGGARHAIGAMLAYLLSLLSKETALSFPLLAMTCAAHPAMRKRSVRETVVIFIGFAAVTAVYLLLRISALGAIAAPPIYGTFFTRTITIPVALLKYAGLLVGIVGADPHHPDKLADSLFNSSVIVSVIFLGLLAALAASLWKKGQAAPFLGLSLTFAPLLPALKLGTFGDVLYADRFLYIPSAGFGILAAWFCMAVSNRLESAGTRIKTAAVVLLCMWLAALFAGALANTRHWRNDMALFGRAVRTSGESAYIRYNYGNALLKAGRLERALEQFMLAARLEPPATFPITNAGIALARAGRAREAIDFFKRAEMLGEATTILYDNMANAQRQAGMLEEAAASYRKSLAIRETDVALNNLGECLAAMGKAEQARECFLSALKLRPSAPVYNNLALAELEMKNYSKAERWLRKALASGDRFRADQLFTLEYNMSRALAGQKRMGEASNHARKALQLADAGYGPPPDSAPIRELTAMVSGRGDSSNSSRQ